MSEPNGRTKRAIEGLATALQECLDAAVESSERRCRSVMDERFRQQEERFQLQDERFQLQDERFQQQDERFLQQDETLRRQDETLRRQDETLQKQNETLRMIWQQCGGRPEQRLPIDD